MKGKRFSEEQIIKVLKQAEAGVAAARWASFNSTPLLSHANHSEGHLDLVPERASFSTGYPHG